MSINGASLDHVDVWLFDLDNTLYPASCRLFDQIDLRMGAFITDLLGCDAAAARRVRDGARRAPNRQILQGFCSHLEGELVVVPSREVAIRDRHHLEEAGNVTRSAWVQHLCLL